MRFFFASTIFSKRLSLPKRTKLHTIMAEPHPIMAHHKQ
jgi:hypothetical protein